MNIACLYPRNIGVAWSMSDGIPRTLQRMGHDVTAFPNAAVEGDCFKCFDLVLVSTPEGLPTKAFSDTKTPIAIWVSETTGREDHDFAPYYKELTSITPHLFFPSVIDAATFNGTYLPYGTDLTVFRNEIPLAERDIPIGFIGQLYPKRSRFLPRLEAAGIHVHVLAQQYSETPQDAVELLVAQYNRIQLFVSLPSLVNCTVAKVYEAAACGCWSMEMHETEESIKQLLDFLSGTCEPFPNLWDSYHVAAQSLEHNLQYTLDTIRG